MRAIVLITFLAFVGFGFTPKAMAACGATDRTWTSNGGNNSWSTNNNWSGNNRPDNTNENAIVVSGTRPTRVNNNYSVGCVDVQSGELRSRNNRTLTIAGDYFNAPFLNTIDFTLNHDNFKLLMAGTGTQTFTAKDPINDLEISNNTTVNIEGGFEIRNQFTLTGTGTNVFINEDLQLTDTTAVFTIPASVVVEVASGKTLTVENGITISGTLKLNPGASLVLGNGTTLTVNAGGDLRLEGASGNSAQVSGKTSFINMSVAGSLYAHYFRFDRVGLNGSGVNVSGTISKMDQGEFHFIQSAGYGLTVTSTTNAPSTLDGISFYDSNGYGNNFNVNATGYNNGSILIDNYAGIGGPANETDPLAQIDWGTQAGTELTLSNNSNVGFPSDPVTAGAASQEFAIFQFALNQTSTATDITSITFTLTGSASASDVDFLQVFNQGASCQVQGAQIGANLIMSGSPAKATVTIPAATVQTGSTAGACVHVYLQTTSAAENNATIGLSINGTSDVTNSQVYSFSTTSGPPVSAPIVTISGDPTRLWKGRNSTNWRANANWQNGGWPSNTSNCQIGSGERVLILTEDNECQNMTLMNTGEISWSNATHRISSTGSLDIQSGFTYTDAANSEVAMTGTSNQSLIIAEPFPNDAYINNSGGASSIISVDTNSTINGDLFIQSGTLRIGAGYSLTVLGNVTVSSGAVLDIEGNGSLILGNNSVVTIDNGATLEMVGGANDSSMTATGVNSFTVVINGTISANKYIFSHLGVNGVTINAGATIDGTNNLLNGTFKHPVNDNSSLLRLFRAVPGDTLSAMTFDLNGSGASSATITNIYTDAGIGSVGPLTITSFSGNLGGSAFDNDNTYLITWSGETNTIDLTQEAVAPTPLEQGTTYNMGRWGFRQSQGGATYVDTDITSIKVTLTGTGSSNDIDQARIYYDSACSGSGGTQLGTGQSFSGNPATATFSGLVGATVPASLTTPPKRCIYIEYDIASDAVNGATVGATIAAANDVVDDQAYGIAGGTPPPIALGTGLINGTSTTWIGVTNTDWFTATNWSSGIPTSNMNCLINTAPNNPNITAGSGICKTMTVGSGGDLTVGAAATLQLYGSLDSSGSVTMTGTLELLETSTSNQTITGLSTIGTLTISKTFSGKVLIGDSSLTINSINWNSTSGILRVQTGKTLILPNGTNISSGRIYLESASTLEVGNGQTLTVSGTGYFSVSGVSDTYPQNLANKGKVTVQGGAGSWGFNSTAGTVSLSGFHFENIDTNGLRIGGTTSLVLFRGGQFTGLSTSYASVKVMQFNTTGVIVSSSTNVGWNWSPNAAPAIADGYQIASSTGCSGQTIDFTGWFGDWYDDPNDTFDTSTKVSNVSCNITLSGSHSPVAMASFTGTPYNGAVDLRWETVLETDHYGFNVYRANAGGSEFIQINDSLIRNFNTSTTLRGNYRFVDFTANNDQVYLYYIQDIAFNGDSELHGPVTVLPLAGLGMPPVDDPNDNNGGRPTDGSSTPDPSTIPNLSYKDLGDGVIIQSQTLNSIRLKIVPGVATFTASAWNGAYEDVSIVGYNKQIEIGKPELLEKVILIEVDESFTTAEVTDSSISTSVLNPHLVTPSPSWVLDVNDKLVASYSADPSVYTVDTSYGPAHFIVNTSLVSVGVKKYLQVKINPLKHNPIQNNVTRIDSLTLDIGLEGAAWNDTPPIAGVSPYAVPNTLGIHVKRTGVFKVTYEDMLDSFVEGPFDGVAVSDFRLFHMGTEIPLEIFSPSGFFSAGDYIKFYNPYFEFKDDDRNIIVLGTEDLLDSGESPKRMELLDGNPAQANANNYYESTYKVTIEENNLAIFDDSLGYEFDHFYWKKLIAPLNDYWENLDFNVDMTNMNSISSDDVVIKVSVKGQRGIQPNLTHHLGLYVNGDATSIADVVFNTQQPDVLTMTVPANVFFDGINSFKLKAEGDMVPGGDYDVIYIDKVEVSYPGYRYAISNKSHIENNYPGENVTIEEFTTNDLLVYDVSGIEETAIIQNTSITTDDGGTTYDVEFFTPSGAEDYNGEEFLVIQNGSELKPISLTLSKGYSFDLKATSNRADLIIIGTKSMLDGSKELVARRESQGLDVSLIDIEHVYAQFSFGLVSTYAIREFVNYSQDYWEKSPKYLLFVGDGTFDPKDLFEYGLNPNTLPMPLVRGETNDFGSDNWFASQDGSSLPRLAVGRIPTSNAVELQTYITKMLNYEDGFNTPDLVNTKQVTFISDSGSLSTNERFQERVNTLAAKPQLSSGEFTTANIDRTELGDAGLRTAILNEFDNGNFMMTYYGHGAEDIWADYGVFENDDVDGLTNDKYPIVVTMNCLNASFYDADETMISLGEKLVLKENAGAIAFFGSTTQTMPGAQMKLANAFYENLGNIAKNGQKNIRLGEIMHLAKTQVGDGTYKDDVLNSFTLIGDPSMKLPEEMFLEVQAVNSAPAPAAGGGGGGCSAGAADGSSTPWTSGLFEWLFFIFLIFATRKSFRYFEN